MSTLMSCPNCEQQLRTPDNALGKKLRCPKCKNTLVVEAGRLAVLEELPIELSKGAFATEEKRSDTIKKRQKSSPERKRGIPWWVWLAGGGGFAVILTVVLVLVFSGGGKDPKFEQIKKGMTEQEVVDLLGETAWSYQKGAVGIWTYPRVTQDDVMQNQERSKEIKDVIFVYFQDGKVSGIYRKSGADFRKPRPGR